MITSDWLLYAPPIEHLGGTLGWYCSHVCPTGEHVWRFGGGFSIEKGVSVSWLLVVLVWPTVGAVIHYH